jgi:hypothetical protein
MSIGRIAGTHLKTPPWPFFLVFSGPTLPLKPPCYEVSKIVGCGYAVVNFFFVEKLS